MGGEKRNDRLTRFHVHACQCISPSQVARAAFFLYHRCSCRDSCVREPFLRGGRKAFREPPDWAGGPAQCMGLDGVCRENRVGDVRFNHRPRGPAQLLGNGNTHSEVRTSIVFVPATPIGGYLDVLATYRRPLPLCLA